MSIVKDAQGRYHLHATAEEVLQLANRIIASKFRRGAKFQSPTDTSKYLIQKLHHYEHEIFAVIFLDNRHRILAYEEMFRGTIDGASVYPREIVKRALELNAAAIIMAHNHPSGEPEPSHADRALTKKVKEACSFLEIRVLDHFIVGGNQSTSFAEKGWL